MAELQAWGIVLGETLASATITYTVSPWRHVQPALQRRLGTMPISPSHCLQLLLPLCKIAIGERRDLNMFDYSPSINFCLIVFHNVLNPTFKGETFWETRSELTILSLKEFVLCCRYMFQFPYCSLLIYTILHWVREVLLSMEQLLYIF